MSSRLAPLALVVTLFGCSGAAGGAGAPGPRGPVGPSMPVIQSLDAAGLPAAPGGTVTLRVVAQSGEGSALGYAWSASSGWDVQGSSTAEVVTLTAPASHDRSGTATVHVTDASGRVATGLTTLTTTGNGAPVVSEIVAAPAELRRNGSGVITVRAADPDADALTYAWTVPAGFTIVSGQGTPQLTVKAAGFVSGLAEVAVGDGTAVTTTGVYLSTHDGAWSAAGLAENYLGGTAYNAQVATDGSGNAIAVWEQYDGTRYNIWANRYAAGAGWGTATLIETDNAGGASAPQVAMDRNGNATAVWYQSDGARNNIWGNRYTAGAGWGSATLLETDNAGIAQSPQVAMDGSGNAIAVWQQSDGARLNVWANRYAVGTGWGGPVLLETDNVGGASWPQLAMDASGNAVAVWVRADYVRADIWANRYTVGAGWGTATLIETNDAGNATNPRVAMDRDGNAIAVWEQSDGTRYSIWANRYAAATGWGAATLIETDDAASAASPAVALDGSGNAIAVWQQSDGTRLNVWANRYVAGVGWGSAARIETGSAGDAQRPHIAMDVTGNAVAVWDQHDGTRTNIWANRFVAGSGWGSAALLETENAGEAYYSQVAMGGGGDAIAVWHQSDGIRNNIWAAWFE